MHILGTSAFEKSREFSSSCKDTGLYNSKLVEKQPEKNKLEMKQRMSDQKVLGFKNGIFDNCKQTG